MYELVIVWDSGDKDIVVCATQEEAEAKKKDFETSFGKQVWCCVRERRGN